MRDALDIWESELSVFIVVATVEVELFSVSLIVMV